MSGRMYEISGNMPYDFRFFTDCFSFRSRCGKDVKACYTRVSELRLRRVTGKLRLWNASLAPVAGNPVVTGSGTVPGGITGLYVSAGRVRFCFVSKRSRKRRVSGFAAGKNKRTGAANGKKRIFCNPGFPDMNFIRTFAPINNNLYYINWKVAPVTFGERKCA